ncbi:hypothetical protein QYZ33_16750, partial [Xanthomonas campestris pv. campestris]|nr:hypothetical protein [Xanthomonas campestris pv. campestris]MEA0910600.1 hypothetical protein [Xanthomonas campestris pv. campestris]
QLHGSLLNIRRVVSRICGALFRGSLDQAARIVLTIPDSRKSMIARAQSIHIQNQRHPAVADQGGTGVAG